MYPEIPFPVSFALWSAAECNSAGMETLNLTDFFFPDFTLRFFRFGLARTIWKACECFTFRGVGQRLCDPMGYSASADG